LDDEDLAMNTVEQLIAHADPAYRRWLDAVADDVLVDNGVALRCRDTLAERNVTYEIATYLPGYLMIGDDSGGNGFLIACDQASGPVFRVDLGSLHEDDFAVVAATFEAWARDGFPLP
jgi:hypothetical protein